MGEFEDMAENIKQATEREQSSVPDIRPMTVNEVKSAITAVSGAYNYHARNALVKEFFEQNNIPYECAKEDFKRESEIDREIVCMGPFEITLRGDYNSLYFKYVTVKMPDPYMHVASSDNGTMVFEDTKWAVVFKKMIRYVRPRLKARALEMETASDIRRAREAAQKQADGKKYWDDMI